MRSHDLRRLILTVFFLGITEFVLLLWIPAGWLALGSGFIGSVLLIIPPLRLEYIKSGRRHLKELKPGSTDLQELQREIDEYFVSRIEEWYTWDSFSIYLGGICLAFYFLFQGLAKIDLVNNHEISAEFSSFYNSQIVPIKQQLDSLRADFDESKSE